MNRKKFLFKLAPICCLIPSAFAQKEAKGQKMLIVYYSWSGNTKLVANKIKDFSNADILEIQPQKPYSSIYKEVVDTAKKERDIEFKPILDTKIPNLSKYDTIVIGSPNWWGTISSPIRTFVTECNLSGKTIAPFITHEGSAMGESENDFKKYCPTSKIINGSAKNSDKDIKNWLSKNNLL